MALILLKLSTKCVSGSKTGCICSWGYEIWMNGYLFTERVNRMSEYSDIYWILYKGGGGQKPENFADVLYV